MKKSTLFIFIVVAVIVMASLFTGAILYKKSFEGKFPGGTYVAGHELSYLYPEEATKTLNKAGDEYLGKKIKITGRGRSAEFTPAELGAKISVEDTVKTLKKIDADWSIWNLASDENKDLPLVIMIDYEKLFATLEQAFKLGEVAPKEATFYFDENKKLAIAEGQAGTVIDREDFMKKIKKSAKNLENGELEIVTINKGPALGRDALLAQEKEISEALNRTVSLLDPVYSDDWHIKLKDHLDWVKFVPKEEFSLPFIPGKILLEPSPLSDRPRVIAIEINQEKLDGFVDEKISKWLDRPGENVNIYTGENGRIVIEGKGSDGKKVQRQFLKQAIELALVNGISNVPIPVVSTTPEIKISEDLRAKGITERISIGHTSYYGSPANRVHNVKTGADRFNGVLLAPGDLFSFNKLLGAVDASTGFKKELVIKQEGTIPEYGGGICQVSTTMYRAALFAGLPIEERNQHSYAVSYYSQILGHGLDATIYLGGPNLKFKNDTGKHLLIQTYTENDFELYIVLYGSADGRRVEMEGPYLSDYRNPPATQYIETADLPAGTKKQAEKAHVGFNALWYRHLFDKDGNEKKEPIATHYKAMPSKIMVGTAQP